MGSSDLGSGAAACKHGIKVKCCQVEKKVWFKKGVCVDDTGLYLEETNNDLQNEIAIRFFYLFIFF